MADIAFIGGLTAISIAGYIVYRGAKLVGSGIKWAAEGIKSLFQSRSYSSSNIVNANIGPIPVYDLNKLKSLASQHDDE